MEFWQIFNLRWETTCPTQILRPHNKLYELALKSGEFSEDAQQRAAMTYLDNVYEQIMDNRAKQRAV